MASKTTLIKASVRKEIIERNVFSYYDNIPWINCEERGHMGLLLILRTSVVCLIRKIYKPWSFLYNKLTEKTVLLILNGIEEL